MLVRSAFSVSIAVVFSLYSLSAQTQSSVASQAGRTSVVEFSTSCDAAVASEINRAVEGLKTERSLPHARDAHHGRLYERRRRALPGGARCV